MTTLSASPEQVRWYRQQRSGLVTPFATPEEAASYLVGVQAQFLSAAGVALWNRTPGLTQQRFHELLYTERTLLKLWTQRHTLHLFPSTEWPLIVGALSYQASWYKTRLESYGGTVEVYEAALDAVEALLLERETLGRSDLRGTDLVPYDWMLSPWGGVFSDLVYLGRAVHVAQEKGEGRFAHRTRWLPDLEWSPPTPDSANTLFAERYFRTYGPSTLKDFAYWRGANVASARPWLAPLQVRLMSVDVEGQASLILGDDVETLTATPPEAEAWPVKMLFRFDVLLLGMRDKSWVVDKENYHKVWRPAGHIEGIVLAHGRGVATWRYDRKGKGLIITIRPFAPLPDYVNQAIETQAQAVADYFAAPLLDIVWE